MRVVPQRSMWVQVAVWFGSFLLGPLTALRLSTATAPDSDLVQIAAVLGFALVFAGGLLLWMGLGVAMVVLRAVRNLVRGKLPGSDIVDPSGTMVPGGYRSFIVLGASVGLLLGLFSSLLTSLSAAAAVGVWLLAGSTYGTLLWLAAHHGFLPFPEPE